MFVEHQRALWRIARPPCGVPRGLRVAGKLSHSVLAARGAPHVCLLDGMVLPSLPTPAIVVLCMALFQGRTCMMTNIYCRCPQCQTVVRLIRDSSEYTCDNCKYVQVTEPLPMESYQCNGCEGHVTLPIGVYREWNCTDCRITNTIPSCRRKLWISARKSLRYLVLASLLLYALALTTAWWTAFGKTVYINPVFEIPGIAEASAALIDATTSGGTIKGLSSGWTTWILGITVVHALNLAIWSIWFAGKACQHLTRVAKHATHAPCEPQTLV